MSTLERREQIIRALSERGFLSVHRAVQLTGASLASIRRDFAQLAADQVAERTRGGLRTLKGLGMAPFAMRQARYSREKELLARRAAQFLQPDNVVMIDGGTTTFHLGACIPPIPLRIITNSIRLAAFLDDPAQRHPQHEIFLTGGRLHPGSGLLVGPGAQSSLAQYHAHWAFLSVGGITLEGLFNTTEQVVETERRMIANADQVVVLADHSKLGKHAMCHVCPLQEVDYLVTDQSPETASMLERFADAGLREITVGAEPAVA